MSVIQKIRDKYARVAVIAIGVALLGFILMDALGNRGGVGDSDKTLGEINGKEIDAEVFGRRVTEIEKQQGPNSHITSQQIVNELWQQELNNTIMGQQYEALGITITAKELDQLLYSANPSPVLPRLADARRHAVALHRVAAPDAGMRVRRRYARGVPPA